MRCAGCKGIITAGEVENGSAKCIEVYSGEEIPMHELCAEEAVKGWHKAPKGEERNKLIIAWLAKHSAS